MYSMIRRKLTVTVCAAGLGVAGAIVLAQEGGGPQQPWSKFKVHDMTRPQPPIVTPGTFSTPDQPGKPPSDAIVLFDGKDMNHWQAKGGGDPTFTLQDGVMLSTNLQDPSNNKYLQSKDQFGDVQLHVEWSEPTPPKGDSQGRGNSGVFMMGLFETQVLDNYQNPTYPDGACIIFTTPRYQDGKMTEPAYITTLQNGVIIQNHQRIEGPTGHMIVAHYPDTMLEKGPIELQFHGNPVRYRNIWVRPLEALEKQQQTGEVAAPAAPETK